MHRPRPLARCYVADVATVSSPPATPGTPADDRFGTTDWALFLAVSGIWGASFLFIDIGLDAMPPGLVTLLRVGLGALALAVIPRPRIPIAADDRGRLVLLSILWVAIPFTLFPIAEQHISSAIAGLLNGATPIFAALFAWLVWGRPTRGAQLAGIGVGFGGVILISVPSLDDGSSAALGVGLIVLATICYGFAVNMAAPLQLRYGSVNLMAKMLGLATVWTAPYGLWGVQDAHWETGPFVAVATLGIVGTGIAFALMGTLVGRVGPTRASFITYLVPVVALVLGVVFRDDVVNAVQVGGVVVVVAGALLASRSTAPRAR